MKTSFIIIKSLIFILLLSSCNKKERVLPINSTTNFDRKIYKEKCLNKGDTIAYYNLSMDYMDSPYDGFLYTALIMANKHGYHLAYEDVYYILTDYYHKKEFTELDDLDQKTREIALDYLKTGAKIGNKECQRILNYYIKNDKIKSTE